MDVPRILCPEIAAASSDSETALCACRTERAIRSADRPAFAEGDLILFRFWCSLRVRLRFGDLLLLGLDLLVLALDLDGVRFFLFDLRLRLRNAFGLVRQHILRRRGIRRKRDGAHQRGADRLSTAACTPRVAAAPRYECRVNQQRYRDSDVQSCGPRQRASPAVVLEIDFSACCHSNPWAESRY